MSEITLAKSITIKTLGADGKDAIRQGKEVDLVRIYGIATGMKPARQSIDRKTGEPLFNTDGSPRMESAPFTGRFEGQNLATGELLTGPVLFLPTFPHSLLEASLQANPQGAKFDFVISAAETDKSPVGYEYKVKIISDPEANDPLAEMRNRKVASASASVKIEDQTTSEKAKPTKAK